MKASIMIHKLQEYITEFGDMEVMFPSEEEYDYDKEVESYTEEEPVSSLWLAGRTIYIS